MLAISFKISLQQAQFCVHSGTTLTISTNTTWSSSMSPTGNVEILAGATLTITGLVAMNPNAYIKVNKGAVLTVDGGILTIFCTGELWQGVIVVGDNMLPQQASPVWAQNPQGTANFRNGARVQHALIGVSNWDRLDLATTGGRIFINNSTFSNNWVGAEFRKYPAFGSGITGNYSSSIQNSEFSEGNLKPHPVPGTGFVGVYIEDVQGIRILGTKFISYNYFFNTILRSGIVSNNASLVVAAGCDQPSPGVYPCPTQYITYPEFTNLERGVLILGSLAQNSVVDEGVFKDNKNDILVSLADNARLTRNTIHKPALTSSGSLSGIRIGSSDGFWVEGNYIEGIRGVTVPLEGINIINAGTEENEVYRNTIKDVTHLSMVDGGATTAFGENRSNASVLISGLQFLCNTYIENSTDQLIYDYQIPGNPLEGIRANQGELALLTGAVSAGNTFTHTLNWYDDIRNEANLFFYLHNGGNSMPFLISPPGSVVVSLAQTSNRCPTRFGEEPGPEDPFDPELGRLMLSSDDRDSLNQAYSYHISLYQDLQNDFFQFIDGGATYELLDQIENASDVETANIMKTSLEAISPYLSEKALKSVAANAYFDLDFTLSLCISNPDATKNSSFLDFMENEAIYPLNENQIQEIINSWTEYSERTDMVQMIGYHNTEASRSVNRLIIDLKLKEGENESFSELCNLYASWPGLRYKYTYVEHLFNNLQVDEATSFLNAIPYTYEMDARTMNHYETYTMFYNLRLQIFESGRAWSELSAEEINKLRMIADRSLSIGSQMALSVLCFYYNDCNTSEPYVADEDDFKYIFLDQEQDPEDINVSKTHFITLWPNPATNSFNISYSDKYESPLDIDIFNMLGKVVKSETGLYSGDKITMDGMSHGQYILVYKHRGAIVGKEKLIKN